ncbi:hypothetical protein RJ641_027381 [Dillenia turbinata]|uniref:TORTIFOLIA1/SINE1-2 N-terminal domain-containing protein n=1 Tax=Dillenia turbinata TaxID=194707 RepID=A0AAN8W2C9_9MAGN
MVIQLCLIILQDYEEMGRNLSPILRQELANLAKDADSRKSAMRNLKSYVKDLDSNAIPLFLAQVSESKETGSSSGEYTISLYEVLARVHGTNIVPQIGIIMSTIIKTLTSSAGSFALHQACSKVVPAIARYGIDPTTPDDKKRSIIHSLCKPLSDSLLGSQEGLSSGAALCLKALVDSDNWRFASDEMVNEVCLRVAGALEEKPTQTNAHMALVMALAKHNSLIVEAYARLLILSGLRILNAGVLEKNSQKRLVAIQMVNFLMKSLDPRSVYSELSMIMGEMEKCQSDQMAYVRGAAFEALQTARRVAFDKGSRLEKEAGSITGSNFSVGDDSLRRQSSSDADFSLASVSPESQTLGSFGEYDSMVESPVSTQNIPHSVDYDRRSVNRNLWRYENGGVDWSLKDGFFSGVATSEHSGQDDTTKSEDHSGVFAGFLNDSPTNRVTRSTTPTPQRSRSQVNVENVKIFTTPRKLVRSLQDPSDANPESSQILARRRRCPFLSEFEYSPGLEFNQKTFPHNANYEGFGNGNLAGSMQQMQGGSESVSSTEDFPAHEGAEMSHEIIPEIRSETQKLSTREKVGKTRINLVCGFLLVLFAFFASMLLIEVQEERFTLVPT